MGFKKCYIESYGCQMNFSDSEIVASILSDINYHITNEINEADLILLNTCSIREKAEQTIRKRIQDINVFKKNKPDLLIGILGCMAERLKGALLEQEKIVDLVVGPDAYRSLPKLLEEIDSTHKAINVLLSREETYAEISPVRLNSNGVTAFVTIMRGCNNMCSFCVVPFTRGRERSRDNASIINECTQLFDNGYREVTLLGQNVDSYLYVNTENNVSVNFAQLLEQVALISPLLRVRFSTSHPKDITDEVLFAMKKYDNICKYIHLPIQSGSTRILALMNRTYTREWYLEKFNRIKEILPECAVSTDVIAGFCTETDEDHLDTLSAMAYCKFDLAYMFAYSERPGTPAAKKMQDDVPLNVKQKRLEEIISLHRQHAYDSMQKEIGNIVEVLIEGNSKRSENDWCGRSDNNKMVVFAKENYAFKKGDVVKVQISDATSATLIGKIYANVYKEEIVS